MAADNRSLSSRWSEFLGSLRTQLGAALVVGLPGDEAARPGNLGADEEGEAGVAHTRSGVGNGGRRWRDDSPGYVTRNGRGSLEVGAFRERTSD